ncbi:MAG: 2Fe-2S iron-sulfur cluster-binding protein [Thermodesulfobacteriota bacterium]
MERRTVNITIDGMSFNAEEGSTILLAARELGIHIPNLCFMENLSPYGGCRICVVEISQNGEKPFIDTSCTHVVKEGMVVQTKSERIIRARKMLAELLVASAPNVKIAQDIAARMGILKVRFPMEDNRCILCGLCIRMCYEQMDGKAIGFAGRGVRRKVSMPFNTRPETCRLCRGCDYVCPGMIIPCHGVKDPGELCGRCVLLEEMPRCCPNSTFGCFCENNPL